MTDTNPTLETARLTLRPLELGDAPAIQRRFPQWEVVKYLATVVPWPYPPDGALVFIRDIALPAIHSGTKWVWTIRLKTAPDDLIGVIELALRPDDNRGFWLVPEVRGQGLMTEATTAVTDFWFNVLEQPVLRVPKAAANTASRQISIRSGMRLISTGMQDYVSGPQLSELWEITREEWLARATPHE